MKEIRQISETKVRQACNNVCAECRVLRNLF